MTELTLNQLKEMIATTPEFNNKFCFFNHYLTKTVRENLQSGIAETIYVSNNDIDRDAVWLKVVLEGTEVVQVTTTVYKDFVVNDNTQEVHTDTVEVDKLKYLVIDSITGIPYVFNLFSKESNQESEQDEDIMLTLVESSILNTLPITRYKHTSLGVVYPINYIKTEEDENNMINDLYDILLYFRSIIGLNTDNIYTSIESEDLDLAVSPESDKHVLKTIYKRHKKHIDTMAFKSSLKNKSDQVDIQELHQLIETLADTSSDISADKKKEYLDSFTEVTTKNIIEATSVFVTLTTLSSKLLDQIEDLKSTIKYQKEQIQLLKEQLKK